MIENEKQHQIESELVTGAAPWIIRLSDTATNLGELVHVGVRSASMMLGVYLIVIWLASVWATWELFENPELSILLTAPEALALFCVARFEKIALTHHGDLMRRIMPIIALINTAFIGSLLLLGEEFYPQWVLLTPLALGAVSLGVYLAIEANQYRAVVGRDRMMQKGEHFKLLADQENTYELASLERRNMALMNEIARRKLEMENQLQMDQAAFQRMSSDPRMIDIQSRAVYVTYVTQMMKKLKINPNSKEGKELLELAREASQGPRQQPQYPPTPQREFNPPRREPNGSPN